MVNLCKRRICNLFRYGVDVNIPRVSHIELLFALDSMPATCGVTHQLFLVFTANAFALLGLRELYYLLKGLPDQLVYLSIARDTG